MEGSETNSIPVTIDTIELLLRDPLIITVMTAVLLVGIMIDVILVTSWMRRRETEGGGLWLVGPKPWGMADLGLLVTALCALLLIAWLVVGWIEHSAHLDETKLNLARLLASAISFNGFGVLAILWMLRSIRANWADAFGMRWAQLPRALGLGLVFFLGVMPPVWTLLAISQMVCHWLGRPVSPQDMAELFLDTDSTALQVAIGFVAVVAAPVFEELFFRGLAYPVLKERFGVAAAMLITSVVFAGIHFHEPSFLPLVGLAMALTVAYEATGNLAVPIVMHSLFNLTTILLMFLASP